MRILFVDNYDSFTYNLVQLVEEAGYGVDLLIKNDQIDDVDLSGFDKILISPGPGLPDEAGSLKKMINEWASRKSILGICLGHQAIGEVFGCKLKQLEKILHGVESKIIVKDPDEALFHGLPQTFGGGRYHSWVVDPEKVSPEIKITAKDEEGHIMALSHTRYDTKGIQFHPESFMTAKGVKIMKNWFEQ